MHDGQPLQFETEKIHRLRISKMPSYLLHVSQGPYKKTTKRENIGSTRVSIKYLRIYINKRFFYLFFQEIYGLPLLFGQNVKRRFVANLLHV